MEEYPKQRTLTLGGKISVSLVYRLDSITYVNTNKYQHMFFFGQIQSS